MVMDEPHVLVIPFPAQGHVKPLMEFSHSLVDCGFSVTFLNTEISHARIMAAISKVDNNRGGKIRFVAFPDGLGPEDDRNQLCNLSEMLSSVMPRLLEELITSMDDSNGGKIKCVIADLSMGWAFQVAAKMGILRAAFWPASAATLASLLHIPKLIEDKVIDANGTL
ncbi:hypothetical protein Sjap_015444 [Stephania japonica]|uniref:Glycosyltransferase N-terminal domain-containing protein n=1 Tax=Stephania japonica TaxID=461633 RepID=A0AAP0NQU2_9MAGN